MTAAPESANILQTRKFDRSVGKRPIKGDSIWNQFSMKFKIKFRVLCDRTLRGCGAVDQEGKKNDRGCSD